ncbi:MAG: hypothetical protein KGI79_03750 [Patescibacteria group bacterium]|nr:hypothetical protein [Patescibacteria group bacterium]
MKTSSLFFAIMGTLLLMNALLLLFAWGNSWFLPSHVGARWGLPDKQVPLNPPVSYSVLQHGGILFDIAVFSWFVALLASAYRPVLWSPSGIAFAAVAVIVTLAANHVYLWGSWGMRDGLNIKGHTTMAGVTHVVYSLPVTWIILMTYFGKTERPVTWYALVATLVVLIALFIVGIIKFDPRWKWRPSDTIQVSVLSSLAVIATGLKLVFPRI